MIDVDEDTFRSKETLEEEEDILSNGAPLDSAGSFIEGGGRRSRSNDFISQMPDEVLVMILSLLPIKEAVVTSILSTRWRFLWRNLTQLNFDGSDTFNDFQVKVDLKMCRLERKKYIHQVKSVIQSYNHPTVHDFRICYRLSNHDKKFIDNWLQFALNKNVEFLELNLGHLLYIGSREGGSAYDFPLRLFKLNRSRSDARLLGLVSLKKLILKDVNVSEAVLQKLLSNAPNLETLSILDSDCLNHVRVGGRVLKLKHFKIFYYRHSVESISLFDFDLVSFEYFGPPIDLCLARLPKLEKVDVGNNWWLSKYGFDHISSCASSLRSLSICIHLDKKNIPCSLHELPNVKLLRVKISSLKHVCLLNMAFIVNACPKMETLKIESITSKPIISRKKARNATNPHQHLKLVEIVSGYGHKCDFELAAYIVQTAVALEKIVITIPDFSKNTGATRSSAKRLESLLPRGAELVLL